MLKVVIFDSGWGGELFANEFEEKVPVVEVTRVIDWRRAPYSKCGRTEICTMTENALLPYIGEVDAIVLASYAATGAALHYLRWKYPHQAFIGFEPDMCASMKRMCGVDNYTVMILATGAVRQTYSFQKDREEIVKKGVKLIEPECLGWIKKVDDGEMTEAELRKELGELAEMRVDMVMLYSTGFVDMVPILESIYGRTVMVVNEFDRVIRETCRMIRLTGGGDRGCN